MTYLNDLLWLGALALAMAATGQVSGTLAGLLGVGCGIVIVPLLFNAFPLFGIPEAVQMKVAVATSLATIIPTSIQSARKHSATGAMDMALLRSIWPSVLGGVVVGTLLAVYVRGEGQTAIFGLVALLVAFNMGFTGLDFKLTDRVPEGAPRVALGLGIGSVSAMMGIGGGTLGGAFAVLAWLPDPRRGRDRISLWGDYRHSSDHRPDLGRVERSAPAALLAWLCQPDRLCADRTHLHHRDPLGCETCA